MGQTQESDARVVPAMRATAHPVRLRILSLLTGADLSAAEIGRELGITHANASYHLRTLADAGLVVEAGEEKIRGGVAKRFRHPWDRADAAGVKPSREEALDYVRVMGEELVRRFSGRAPGTGSFTADAEMWVAPEVWTRVDELVREAARLVHAEARPPRTPGTVHVNLTVAAFTMSDPAPGEDVR